MQVVGISEDQTAGSWTVHRGKGSGYAPSGGLGEAGESE